MKIRITQKVCCYILCVFPGLLIFNNFSQIWTVIPAPAKGVHFSKKIENTVLYQNTGYPILQNVPNFEKRLAKQICTLFVRGDPGEYTTPFLAVVSGN